MSEPREIAPAVDQVAPGLWHWRISNSSIGGYVSSSQAVMTREGCVLIDPIRLDDAALGGLPRPTRPCVTARCHQRAAWRYRRDARRPRWLPEDASAADEEPDHTYADGDLLPGGLSAFRTPGPSGRTTRSCPRATPASSSARTSSPTRTPSCVLSPRACTTTRGDEGERGGLRPALRHPVLRARRAHLDDPKAALRDVLERGD